MKNGIMIKSRYDLELFLYADAVMRNRQSHGIKQFVKDIISPDYIWRYLVSMRHCAYFINCRGKYRFLSPQYWYHVNRFRKLGMKLGFSIGVNSLGYGVVIPHYGTIVVNDKAYLGNYCVLHTSTCIVGEGMSGDALYLSTGSVLIYPAIGNSVSVAANSVVRSLNESPSDVLLVGSPAIIKRKSYPAWYIRDGIYHKIKQIESYKLRMFK